MCKDDQHDPTPLCDNNGLVLRNFHKVSSWFSFLEYRNLSDTWTSVKGAAAVVVVVAVAEVVAQAADVHLRFLLGEAHVPPQTPLLVVER